VQTTAAMGSVIAGHQRERERGLLDRVTYYADPRDDSPFIFGYRQPPHAGWALACFAFRYHAAYRSASGARLFQDTYANNWGGWLAPGRYSSITDYGLQQTCAVVPPADGAGLIAVLGDEGGIVDVTGTP
jgi:hypothetical protein